MSHTAYHAPILLSPIICVICNAPTDANCATAGSLHLDGRLAFACTAHLRERRIWFTAWCIFEAAQRRMLETTSYAGAYAAISNPATEYAR